MKKLLFLFATFFIISNVNAQVSLDKIYSNTTEGFLLRYPSTWLVDETKNPEYLVKIQDSEKKVSLYVKKSTMKTIMDATKLVKEQVEPAWEKGGSMIVPLPVSAKELTPVQLAMRNAISGYNTLIKTAQKTGDDMYTGYTFLINGYNVYEIKSVMYNSSPIDIVKTVPKIATSVNILR